MCDRANGVMAGLVPAIRLFPAQEIIGTWLRGTTLALGPAEGRTRVPA